MPDTLKPLEPVKVHRHYVKTEVSKGISEYQGLTGTTKAAVAGDADRNNRTWTTYDTVAHDIGSLVLTVKFLSATEAGKLLRNDVRKRLMATRAYVADLEKYEGTFVDPPVGDVTDIKKAAKEWSAGKYHLEVYCARRIGRLGHSHRVY